MEQLGLFAALEPATALPAVRVEPLPEWWLSDDVAERREGVLRSAAFWQDVHERSGLQISQESIYAERLRVLAGDMELRPEFHRAKPANVSDFQWFYGAGRAS